MAKAKEPDSLWTVTALAALAHEHRLAAYRFLVQAGPAGISAGEIAEKLGLAASSLTFHIQALLRAGLVTQRRASRHVIYAADFAAMNGLDSIPLSPIAAAERQDLYPGLRPCLAEQVSSHDESQKSLGLIETTR